MFRSSKRFKTHTLSFYSFTDCTGTLWIQANALTEVLGYARPDYVVNKHVGGHNQLVRHMFHTKAESVFINETGLYELIMHSKRKNAVELRHWVTNELIPPDCKLFNGYPDILLEQENVVGWGYIYVATTEEMRKRNLYNIGATTRPEERKTQLNTSSPDNYGYIYIFGTIHYQSIVKYIHRAFYDNHFNREFFTMSDKELDELFDYCRDIIKEESKLFCCQVAFV